MLTFKSHCPWIHNCVGSNNQRHFLVYIIALEAGMLFFIRLVVYRRWFIAKFIYEIIADISKISKIFRNPRRRSATSSQKAFVDTYCVILSLWSLPSGHVCNYCGSPCYWLYKWCKWQEHKPPTRVCGAICIAAHKPLRPLPLH